MSEMQTSLALARWRLLLGRFAEQSLSGAMGGNETYRRLDRVLDFLYGREYRGRGVKDGCETREREGGLGDSVFAVPEWLAEVRTLFPRETCEVLQRHALDRYHMAELVTDKEVMRQLEPSYELLKTVLSFKGMMKGDVLHEARRLVRRVVEDLKRKLETDVRRAISGTRNRRHRTSLKIFRNLDVRRTIRDNLRHWDPERRRIVLENLHFFSRVQRHLPWRIIMAVDCSGSMIDSVIHSAVMAGIFHALPAVTVELYAFDTNIVDFTDRVDDPVEVLMSVQLGGGTDIAKALDHCESRVAQPARTIVIFVTDFYEGGSPSSMFAAIKRMRGAGVRVVGLAALDAEARPNFDEKIAGECVDAGAEVAALTPGRLAEWLANAIR